MVAGAHLGLQPWNGRIHAIAVQPNDKNISTTGLHLPI
jgi:hypothetical protein